MKKTIPFLTLLFLAVFCFGQKKDKIKGNKEVTTVAREIIRDFNAIEIDDALEVNLRQANENSYILTTDENLQDVIIFRVKDSILTISTTHRIRGSKKLEISLNAKNTEYITLKNNAKLRSDGILESNALFINAYQFSRFDVDVETQKLTITMLSNASGKLAAKGIENTNIVMGSRSDLRAEVKTDKVAVNISNKAQIRLRGNATAASFNLQDKAELDARAMNIERVDLVASNNSDVYVQAKKTLTLFAKGKSNIYVFGSPEMEIKGLADKSKIIKR